MTTPSEQDGPPVSYPYFDWLRFAMASTVALVHQSVIGWAPAANVAVQVFFALSGWLIGGILLRTERSGLPRFFYNRGSRIWIPYAFAVIALFALAALRDGVSANWWRYLFFDGTFTHNWFVHPEIEQARMPLQGTNNHFWSIAVEEQFYLAAPLIMLGLAFGKRLWMWAVIAAFCVAVTPHFGSISLGVLAAVAQRSFGNWHVRARPSLFGLAAASLGALLVWEPAYRLAAPFFAIATVLLLAVPGQRSGVGEFFGGVSYPLYLNHWIGTFAANAVAKKLGFWGTVSAGLLGYTIAVAVGCVAYVLIDRNIQRLRGKHFTRRKGLIFAGAAYALLVTGLIGGAAMATT